MKSLARPRIIASILTVIVLVVALGLLGGGWYYSNVLRDGGLLPDHSEPKLDMIVAGVADGRITLNPSEEAEKDGPWTENGLWGLELEGEYHGVGSIISITESAVVREFMPRGESPASGELARLDNYSFSDNPGSVTGIPFTEVSYSSPIGEFSAWMIDGTRNDWAIFVHGKGAERGEALRMLPVMVDMGYPSLVITYRNDLGEPANQDGYYHFGQTEWVDLEGAVKYALDEGAKNVVLVGYSMGGAIVVNFLYESEISQSVEATILDAPMLDFNATIDLGARERGAPGILTAIGKMFTSLRFGIDLEAIDYLKSVDELSTPILLFHGDADDIVPIETSETLAKARPDLVNFVRVPGAGHVRAWNLNPTQYEAEVREFMSSLSRR
ncbi:MAG: alpha/beta hydrolase [SAR202 cluster bacterium]|nr:alpha/beta hydrolase [SAR202 cluster bacterium]